MKEGQNEGQEQKGEREGDSELGRHRPGVLLAGAGQGAEMLVGHRLRRRRYSFRCR